MRAHARVLSLALCLIAPGAAAGGQLRSVLIAGGFDRPVAYVQAPDDPAVAVVVEQSGRVRLLYNGEVQSEDFLDLSGDVAVIGELGLLGFAFDPAYSDNGRVYAFFSDHAGNSVLARFQRSEGNPLAIDHASRFDFVWPDGESALIQPFGNHKGGHLAFGPDGFLYVGTGDGGGAFDPDNLAQSPSSLLGKMLRLDVTVPDNHGTGYVLPDSNPFVGNPEILGEIWAFGVRNPWRWSFDDAAHGGTGALVMADVGQNHFEEINYQPAGRGGLNYGWRVREGMHDLITDPPAFSELTDPIFEYAHPTGFSITGGYVYRGTSLGAQFYGRYFFADYVTSRVWSIGLSFGDGDVPAATTLIEHTDDLDDASLNISSFGVDANGELYSVNRELGAVYRIAIAPVPPSTPGRQSDLALYRPTTGEWRIASADSNWSENQIVPWGLPTDLAVKGDVDGDQAQDLIVWRPGIGTWFVRLSTSTFAQSFQIQFGLPGDVPKCADFDGDGRDDLVVYRPSNGTWYVRLSVSGFETILTMQWGLPSDTPLPADFDGDGRADFAVFRSADGGWYIRFSTTGYSVWNVIFWGLPGDLPMPGDFDGDAQADIAIYRPSNGTWYIRDSSTNYTTWWLVVWGQPGDVPVLLDIDGDLRSDVAVWRPDVGEWLILTSSTGFDLAHFLCFTWGAAGDVPMSVR